MKQYKILAESIPGIKGNKQLLKGKIYPSGEFNAEHIADLINQEFIIEVTNGAIHGEGDE